MIDPQKEIVRSHIRKARNGITSSAKHLWDTWLNEQLMATLERPNLKVIMAFYPIKNEPDLRPFMRHALDQGHTLLLPVTPKVGPIYPAVLKDLTQLASGPFGTKHPVDALPYDGAIDLILVPGLAFSKSGDRLGYGAGYYDQLLPKYPKAQTWGIAYPFQVLDQIPTAPHDWPLDQIITPI
jgi:5-formyltetrahydrofolate cyclo-ligase